MRPKQINASAHDVKLAVEDMARAIRSLCALDRMESFAPSLSSLAVKATVHRIRTGLFMRAERKGRKEGVRLRAATFETRPVTGGERGDFIEKEQLGIACAPNHALALFELAHACNPATRHMPARAETTVVTMKAAAPIAHQRAARRCRVKFASGINAVLQRRARGIW